MIISRFQPSYQNSRVEYPMQSIPHLILIDKSIKQSQRVLCLDPNNNLKIFQMDNIFAIKGNDFVAIAADTTNMYSVMKMKNHEDKIWQLDDGKLLALGGEHSDILQFGDYIQRNLKFLELKNGIRLSTTQTANFIRSELAEALRKGPYHVNCILAGIDEDGPKLYWIDYLGTLIENEKAAHGYAEYFVHSTMDTLNKANLTADEGINIINYCINEMKTRFLANQNCFTVKLLTKEGIKVIQAAEKPIPVQCG